MFKIQRKCSEIIIKQGNLFEQKYEIIITPIESI